MIDATHEIERLRADKLSSREYIAALERVCLNLHGQRIKKQLDDIVSLIFADSTFVIGDIEDDVRAILDRDA